MLGFFITKSILNTVSGIFIYVQKLSIFMDITDAQFEKEVIKKSQDMPVVVDFWASWCGPCMMLKPIIERIASDSVYEGKVHIVKLNVEQNQEMASKYGIMSIPAVKLFKDGEVVDEFMGVQPEETIRGWIDKNL